MSARRPAARRGLARGLAALLGLCALAGCGIQNTEVVEAGAGAPVTVRPAKGARLMLFFVAADGRLMPVVRDVGLGGDRAEYRVATDVVLRALYNGPDARERAAGATTRLTEQRKVHAGSEVRSGGRRVIVVGVAGTVGDLDPVAVRQLVCTAGYAEAPGQDLQVEVVGVDGPLPATRCELE
ncbi:hypothetical protein ACGFMM_02220 [Streptomyces sp. NPDC048604]|uniref:hypothetical protein n=1 Tax=Streptomyces sp. NPDC048604 TaxID=3365578 RepID=UPI0037192956